MLVVNHSKPKVNALHDKLKESISCKVSGCIWASSGFVVFGARRLFSALAKTGTICERA